MGFFTLTSASLPYTESKVPTVSGDDMVEFVFSFGLSIQPLKRIFLHLSKAGHDEEASLCVCSRK